MQEPLANSVYSTQTSTSGRSGPPFPFSGNQPTLLCEVTEQFEGVQSSYDGTSLDKRQVYLR